MNKNIEFYSEKLISMSEEIEKEFKNLKKDNFSELLEGFGYCSFCINVNGYVITDDKIKIEEYIDNNKLIDVEKEIDKIKNYIGLYIFEETSKDALTVDKWTSFKEDMKYSDNKVPQWNKQANCNHNLFYLGKSNRIGQRIKEHILKCSNSTYALKLNAFQNKYESQFKYKIHIFYLESEDNNRKNAVNELVESILHSKLKPKIGSK